MLTASDVAPPRTELLKGVTRVVIKVGSAVIAEKGQLRESVMDHLAGDVAALRAAGVEVVMVVSGAVAAGFDALGMPRPPIAVVERQAAASVGQYKLLATFARSFSRHNIEVAQLLISADDVENRRRFLSARHTMQLLLERSVVPIINENDALADDELKIGDNDHLAALVTNLVSAQLLIVLSNVEGIYRNGDTDSIIHQVDVGSSIDEHITSQISDSGVGGMAVKVAAVRLASRWGVPGIIASGKQPGVLPRLLNGESLGTLFVPRPSTLNCRKRWIAFRKASRGVVRVTDVAKEALLRGAAGLAPSGVRDVGGQFSMGARVDLVDAAGANFAVGLASYSADEIRRMQGRDRTEFNHVLGYEYVPYIVSSDDMVPLTQEEAKAIG